MKRWREGLVIGLVVCVLLAGAVSGFLTFQRDSARDIQNSVYASLNDLAREQSVALQAEINGQFDVLRTLAAAVDGQDSARVRELLGTVCTGDMFGCAGVVDAGGEGYLGDGTPVSADAFGGLEAALNGGRSVAYLEGEEGVTFVFSQSAPGGGAVFACYPEERFVSLLSSEAMDARSYAFVARSDGHIIVHSDHPSYVNISDNTLSFYEEVVMEQDSSAARVADDLANGRGGMLSYSYGNQYRYVIYAPLQVNDWYLFNVLQGAQVDERVKAARNQATELAGKLLTLSALAAAFMIWRGLRGKKRLGLLQEKLWQSEQLRHMAEQMSYTILFEADPATGELTYNDSFERQLGRKPVINNFHQFLRVDSPLSPEEAPAWRRLAEEMKRGLPKSQVSVQMSHRNGEKIWYRVSFETLYNHGQTTPVRIVGRFANIERQEREQDRQLASAERDELTGLMGHMAFMQRAGKRMAREGDCTLMIADIDGFKGARDIDGRYQGDQLLVRMSEAMRHVFGQEDLLGRLGGDTFAVLMTGAAAPEYVAERAQALCERFEAEDGHTCSVGIAMSGGDADTISELSHRADKALYRAKLAGKHRYEFYEAMLPEAAMQKRHSGGDINSVLQRCAISLLTNEVLAVGMDDTLREVAEYYHADCAYVIEFCPKEDAMCESFGWYAPGYEETTGEPHRLSKSAMLSGALAGHQPVALAQIDEKTVQDARDLAMLRERRVTALYMVPLGKACRGFIAIDNPRDHVGNVTLLRQIASCVTGAIGKARKDNSK